VFITDALAFLEVNFKFIMLDLQLANLPDKDIVEMIFFPVVNEACRVLAEGIAVKASDLDIAAVMGMGFPPYRYCSVQSL